MRTSMVKRYFCLLVVLLFVIPSVTALSEGIVRNQNENNVNSDLNVAIEEKNFNVIINEEDIASDFIPIDQMSMDVQEILKKYPLETLDQETKEYLVRFNEKMLEREFKWALETPDLKYVPVDITNTLANIDPETGEISSMFPGAELMKREYKLEYFEYNPASSASVSTYDSSSSSGTRSSRQLASADLFVEGVEWTAVNSGWGNWWEDEDTDGNQYSIGGFQMGKPTTITVTIGNDGPATSVSNIEVNFTIRDWDSLTPMEPIPASETLSITGASGTVDHTITPRFAGQPLIQITINYPADPNPRNNGVYLTSPPLVFIWSADFESSGTNYGWQKLADGTTVKSHTSNDWTGDKGTTNSQWHMVTNPDNNLINEHTRTSAWFHGDSGAFDTYQDDIARNTDADGDNHTFLETPVINMGNIFDGQKYKGNLNDNTIDFAYTPQYAAVATGELEVETFQQGGITYIDLPNSDFVHMWEYADNAGGDEWWDKMPVGMGIFYGQWEQWNQQTGFHWNPIYFTILLTSGMASLVGYPFDLVIGDGTGGTQELGGADNWTTPGVRFRCDFMGDGYGDDSPLTGVYVDDFVTWGMQDYMVEHRVGITELTYPLSDMDGNDVPILFKEKTATFSSTVKNFGEQQQVPVVLSIYEIDENGVMATTPTHTQTQQATIANDAEKDHSWSWSPTKEGEYMLILTAGDPDADWTPNANQREFYLHVGPVDGEADVDILVVDDDASVGGTGLYYQDPMTWRYIYSKYVNLVNTEDKMLKALTANELKYRVYTVAYNETGPSFDIMSQFELVIWMTGLDNEFNAHGGRSNYKNTNPNWDVTLKTDDLTEIEKFLNLKDKKFWLISPGFIYDYYGAGASLTASSDFARQYLHIAGCRANVTKWNDEHSQITEPGTQNPLEGVAGTIMGTDQNQGVEYTTYPQLDPPFDPPEGFNDIGGWIESADADTDEIFYQDDIRSNKNAVIYKGPNYMSAFFSFNFYLLSDADDRRDLVYRMLTGFEMTGGVIITPLGESQKLIYPGQEISFRFTVENTGKKQDTMTLSVTKPSDYNDWTTRWEVDSIDKNTVAVPALAKSTKVYLYIAAPEFEDSSDYEKSKNRAGTMVKFAVKAVSQLTSLDNSTVVHARIGAVGNITLTCPQPTDVIEVKETARFQLRLFNETNGDDDVTVQLSFDGAGMGLAKFSINGITTNQKDIEVILEPNDENSDIEIQVTAGDHTLTGYHNLTAYVKDEIGDITHDSVDLSIRVEQFYQVKCTTEGDIDDGEVNFTLDPNNYTDEEEDYIKKSFMINVRNYGNGYDEISLMAEENEDSEDTSDWLIPIISPDTEENISSVNVGYYDITKIPKYGEEEVQFDVYIPIDVDEGTYILDFIIQSSHTEVINLAEDETKNNILSFQFDIIKPNLQFTKFTPENADNFVFADFLTSFPILRDYEYNNLFYYKVKHSDFDQLAIEFKISIDNIGDNEIDIEPSNIWLNITYQDEFGDTIAAENLTPYLPTSAKLIAPGENTSFTFLWEFIDQEEQGSEIEYTFTVTVDPLEKIYETQEDDNSDEVQLTIKHEKKPRKKSSDTPGFETLIFIAAISIVIIALYDHRRRNK